jgi:hypothetical protein
MAPQLSEDEVDDLIYFARAGEEGDLSQLLLALAEREKVSSAEIFFGARDSGKSTCLHMAAGNGHSGKGHPMAATGGRRIPAASSRA